MTARDLAISRSRAYRLLSRLYLEGLTPELLATARTVPGLARVLPESYGADEAAARHFDLFSMNVFPYAASYLEAGYGNATVESVAAWLATADFHAGGRADRVDHLGVLLEFLAHETLRYGPDGRLDAGAVWQEPLAAFLDAYLLSWLPPFLEAVARYRDPFYTEVAGLTLDLIAAHRRDLPDGDTAPEPEPPPGGIGFGPGDVARLARYLATPAACGLLISRRDLTHLVRSLDVPAGFGDRVLMLKNLLHAAARFEQLPHLAALLRQRVATSRAFYQTLEGASSWNARLEHLEGILDTIENGSRGAASPRPDV